MRETCIRTHLFLCKDHVCRYCPLFASLGFSRTWRSQKVSKSKKWHDLLSVHTASPVQLKDFFSAVASKVLQQAVLHNYMKVVRRVLQTVSPSFAGPNKGSSCFFLLYLKAPPKQPVPFHS